MNEARSTHRKINYLTTAVILLSLAVIAWAGPPQLPDHDVAYQCLPIVGNGPPVQIKFTNTPFAQLQASIGISPQSNDTQSPVIVSVTNSAGVNLLPGNVKLLAANNGLPLTVTATDNVGVVGGKLEVDGKLATPFGNGIDVQPSPIYVRWNAKTVPIGLHTLRLTIWDAANNTTAISWSMTK